MPWSTSLHEETDSSVESTLPALLFVHGYPDGPGIWNEVIEHYKRQGGRKLFTLALPNAVGVPAEQRLKRGASFDEIVDGIIKAVEEYRGPLIYVGHDWGAYLGYWVDRVRPGVFSAMALIDVSPEMPVDNWTFRGVCLMYQVPAAIIYLLGGALGDWLAAKLAVYLRAPNPELVTADMGFYYIPVLLGQLPPKRLSQRSKDAEPNPSQRRKDRIPSCPLLYTYGEEKPCQFHTDRWVQAVEALPDCRVAGFRSIHWLFLDRKDEFLQVLDEFLRDQS